jgi:DNA-binding NarL/FixJ family response regulator
MYGDVNLAAIAPVAVVDQGVPIYEFGVAELLRRSGLDVTQSGEPLAWAAEPGNRALVLVLRSERDWELLQGLTAIPGSLLVAVMVKPDLEMYRRALDGGALTAIGWNVRPSDLVKAVTAAAGGDRLLPRSIALALQRREQEPVPDWYALDDDDLYLLGALRAGKTQVGMARHISRSDRGVRRRLTALYTKLDVRTGGEAITKSANWNLGPT